MSRNLIRRSNNLQARKAWKLLSTIVVLALLGMVFVFLQVRNIQLADEVKKLETDLAEVNRRNNALRLEIEHRMKPRALQEKIAEYRLDLINVADLPKVKAPMTSAASGYYGAYAQKEGGTP
ncbi:MAG: hypothetical protein ACOY3I_04540 [Verrucomicrobiota bacterium]